MLRIALLGRPSVAWNDVPLGAAPRPKTVALLAYLMLHAVAERKHAAPDLWPDHTDAQARANLRRHLQYLRAWLPEDSEWVLSDPQSLRWNSRAPFSCDAQAFAAALDAGNFERAAALYSGELCESLDEPWLDERRRSLAERHASALLDLAASARARSDYDAAAEYASRLLGSDPWREDALRQLLLARYESGDRSGALRAFATFRERLRDELNVEPGAETLAMIDAIARDIPPAGSAALRPLKPRTGELPFEGRERELQALRAAFDESCAGGVVVAFLVGEAGIGKTRLLREFAIECETRGACVVFGAGSQPENRPYQPLASVIVALAPLAQALGSPDLWSSALDPLLDPRADAGLPELEPSRERWRLFESVAVLLERIAQRRPLCLLLEEMHWAGEGTLQLLRYLLRRLRRSRILFALTFRSDEAAARPAVRSLRRDIAAEYRVFDVALHTFDRQNVAHILERFCPDRLPEAESLWLQSDGNPLYLSTILASPGLTAAAFDEALENRVDALDPPTRGLAELCAVFDGDFDIDVLMEVTGWDEATVADALDRMIDSRLLVLEFRRGRTAYRFAHNLVRAALYERIAIGTRKRQHRRIAKVLERLYAPVSEDMATQLARHWDRAGEGGRAAAFYLMAAQRAMRLFAVHDARPLLDRAIALAADPQIRFDAIMLAEEGASIRGERTAQAALLRDAESAKASLTFEERALVLQRRCELGITLAEYDEVERNARELRALARSEGSHAWEAAALETEIKRLRSTGQFDEEERGFEELRRLIGGAAQRYARAYLAHADSLLYRGRIDQGVAFLNELLAIEAELDRRALVQLWMSFSRAALIGQRYPEMTAYAQKALDLSVRIGDREGEAHALHNIANGTMYAFDVPRTAAAFERATLIYEELHNRLGLAGIAVDRGLFFTERGDLANAVPLYEQAIELAKEINSVWVTCVAYVNASYNARLACDADLAHHLALKALETSRTVASPQLESAALGVLGSALTELGKFDEARDVLERAVLLRRDGVATPRLGDNLCALVTLHVRAHNIAAAQNWADELMEIYTHNPALAPQPVEWLTASARAYRAAGLKDRAAALLTQAREIFATRSAALPHDTARAGHAALPFHRELPELTASLQKSD